MQNCSNSGSLCLVHTNQTWTFPLNEITIKVPKCTKYGIHIRDESVSKMYTLGGRQCKIVPILGLDIQFTPI